MFIVKMVSNVYAQANVYVQANVYAQVNAEECNSTL